MTRTYSELIRLSTFEERYRYLAIKGRVGEATFGHARDINQSFYTSHQWRRIRQHVIARDAACDLGIEGYEIYDRVVIHHMNPMRVENLVAGDPEILDPEFLITTTHQTHNAIHYGDEKQLPQLYVGRYPGDTDLVPKGRA